MPGRVLVALSVVAVLLTGCRRSSRPEADTSAEPRVVPVAVRPAETGSLRTAVHATGIVTPAEGAEFLAVAPEPARIVEITRMAGEMVAAGEVLVRFDLPSAAQAVAREAAELERAQVQAENARAAHARTRDFVERGLVPRRDLETAERELADAQRALDRARAAQAAAEAAAARAVVRAPFAGLVAARLHEPGDLVQASPTDPVLRLVDPGRLEITALIPVADASRVLPGATARIAGLLDGRIVPLRVLTAPSPRTGGSDTTTARLAFLEPPAIAVDTRVEVDIDAEERAGVVFVPAEALVRDGSETAVFVADGTTARRRTVTTGITDGLRVEITSGITAGDLVITRGQIGLTDGAAVSAAVAAR